MSASRLREMTKRYEKRRAAEIMAEIPQTAGELAHEGVHVMRDRIRRLEQERDELRTRVEELEVRLKELDADQ